MLEKRLRLPRRRNTACGRSSRACPTIRFWPASPRSTCATGAARPRSCRRACEYELRPRYGPTVKWCDIPVTRVWRCGNRGNVASVLIEKPARGDFLPILDGGFSLQYSPLLEYREGQGLVLFCQLDVTGRTETDPAAENAGAEHPRVRVRPGSRPRAAKLVYAGDPAGSAISNPPASRCTHTTARTCRPTRSSSSVPAASATSHASKAAIADWLKAGGNLLAIGLDERGANGFLPFQVQMKKGEHISPRSIHSGAGAGSLLAGIGPADVHNRDPGSCPW